eukprot:scaffold10297_cov113-Isochrysis_galbana.AAC.1
MVRRYRLPGPERPRDYGISVGSPCEPFKMCNASTILFTAVPFPSDGSAPMPNFSEYGRQISGVLASFWRYQAAARAGPRGLSQ